MMTFGEYVMMNRYNINDSYTMQQALKNYAVYEEMIWCLETAAKYFEVPEETWDGWDWEVYEDGDMLENNSFPTAPWHIFQKNPLTGEMWAPSDDVAEVVREWGLVKRSVNEKYAFLNGAHIPGYNHGWDEVALEKEQHIKDLHDWGLHASAENFYEDVSWTYEVLNKYDRIEGLLEWARSLPEETDPDLEWSDREQEKARILCDFAEKIQEMIDSKNYSFEAFPMEFSPYDMKNVTYGAYDTNDTWHYVVYYTGINLLYIHYAEDEYRFDGKRWRDNKVPSKEVEYFTIKAICMKYAEMFGLSK